MESVESNAAMADYNQPKKEKIRAHKFVLSSGKVLFFKEMNADDFERAIITGAQDAQDNQTQAGLQGMSELVKRLLVSVDGVFLDDLEKESWKKMFTMAEYFEVSSCMTMIMNHGKKGDDTAPKHSMALI